MKIFNDLFKTPEERKRELQRRQRRAQTKAEDAILQVNTSINKLSKDMDKAWAEAKNSAAAGHKNDAMLSLQQYRNYDVLIYKLKKRQLQFKDYILRMETVNSTVAIIEALEEFNKVMEIDVNGVVEVIDSFDESLLNANEMERMLDSKYDKSVNGMEMQEADIIPDVNSLFDKLQGEVALEIGGGAKDISTTTKSSINDVEAKLNSLNQSEK